MLRYYFEWFENGGRVSTEKDVRVLLYGDITMQTLREQIQKIIGFGVDVITTNIPLSEQINRVDAVLREHRYRIVVVGEGGNGRIANSTLAKQLLRMHSHVTFIFATAPSYSMHSVRYKGDDLIRRENNDVLRGVINKEYVDIDEIVERNHLSQIESIYENRKKLAWLCWRLRLWKHGRNLWRCKKENIRLIRNTADVLIGRLVAERLRAIIDGLHFSRHVDWINEWLHEEDTGLIIGDSNIRSLCRANSYLTNKVSMYASAYSVISKEMKEVCTRLLERGGYTHVAFSYGSHHLTQITEQEFEEGLNKLVSLFHDNNRKVLLFTVSEWADRKKLSVPDKKMNEKITLLNSVVKRVAENRKVECMDMQELFKNCSHADHVHFHHSSYIEPALRVVNWFKSPVP